MSTEWQNLRSATLFGLTPTLSSVITLGHRCEDFDAATNLAHDAKIPITQFGICFVTAFKLKKIHIYWFICARKPSIYRKGHLERYIYILTEISLCLQYQAIGSAQRYISYTGQRFIELYLDERGLIFQ